MQCIPERITGRQFGGEDKLCNASFSAVAILWAAPVGKEMECKEKVMQSAVGDHFGGREVRKEMDWGQEERIILCIATARICARR